MKRFVLLLRGINVTGRNVLRMKELAALLEDLGCRNIRTYIQSGNVLLESRKSATALAGEISAEIGKRHGFQPHALVIEWADFEQAIAANPFPEAESDPTGLHFGFLDSVPTHPDLLKLDAMKGETERFQWIGKVFYLHAPDGVGRSKLAASSERLLGVPMTDRNWRTVSTLRNMGRTE